MEDFARLFRATFDLPEWLFIPRGEDFTPYIASKNGVADSKPMIRAFTDAKRLHRFSAENGLLEADGQALMISIKTSSVIEFLEQFEVYDVHGVWFNSDRESEGYFTPIKQLRVIKDYLDDLTPK